MGMSSHEILIMLRARDEASRILGQFKTGFGSVKSAIPGLNAELKNVNTSIAQQRQLLDQVPAGFTNMRSAIQGNITELQAHRAEILNQRNAIEQQVASAGKIGAVGSVMTGVGAAATAMGAEIVSAYRSAIDASNEYQQKASMTMTQVDGAYTDSSKTAKISMSNIKQYGFDTASSMPVAFNKIQTSLYDVFSSIDTDGAGAQQMLKGIGTAAVAGGVDMETAGRGIMEVMNGWGMKASDTGHINDVMFKMVQKGIGTYDQFSSSIGRSIPSAVKAGATFEDMAGGMAFMTRQGLSTQMAATSLGRAFDLMSNPKFEENMNKIGLTTLDSQGNFKDFGTIVSELRGKLGNMNEGDRSKFLKDLTYQAGGTIQAMRFFNHAIMDSNGSLNGLQAEMHNSKGAAKEAYDIMAATPQAKIQMLANQVEMFKVKMGDALQPVQNFVLNGLMGISKAFNSLSPQTQDMIFKVGAIVGAFLLVGGAITTVVGIFMMISSAAGMVGLTFSGIAIAALPIVAAIAGLVAVGALIVTNWNTIKQVGLTVWNAISTAVQQFASRFMIGFKPAIELITHMTSAILPALMSVFDKVSISVGNVQKTMADMIVGIQPLINQVMPAFQAAIVNIQGAFAVFVSTLGTVVGALATIATFIGTVIVGVFGFVSTVIMNTFAGLIAGLQPLIAGIISFITGVMNIISGILTGNLNLIGQGIVQILGGLVGVIIGIFTGLTGAIIGIVTGIVTGFINLAEYLYDVLVGHSIFPDLVLAILQWIGRLPGEVIAFIQTLVTGFINLVTGLAAEAGQAFMYLISTIVSVVSQLPGAVLAFVTNLVNGFVSGITGLWNQGVYIFNGLVNGIVGVVQALPGLVISFINSLVSDFLNKVAQLKSQGQSDFGALVGAIIQVVGTLPGKIALFIGNLVTQFLVKTGILKGKAIADFQTMVLSISAKVGELPNKVMTSIGNMVSQAITKIDQFKTDMVKKFTEMITGAVNEAKQLPGKITGALSNIGSTVRTVGTNIINGMKDGVTGAARGLIDAAKGAVSDAVSAAKNLLGIHSPSKVWAWMGDMSVEGMRQRLVAGQAVMSKAGESLAKSAIPKPEDYLSTVTYSNNGSSRDNVVRGNLLDNPDSPLVNVIVNTQEIDPAKHSAELAYEIVSRLGF